MPSIRLNCVSVCLCLKSLPLQHAVDEGEEVRDLGRFRAGTVRTQCCARVNSRGKNTPDDAVTGSVVSSGQVLAGGAGARTPEHELINVAHLRHVLKIPPDRELDRQQTQVGFCVPLKAGKALSLFDGLCT